MSAPVDVLALTRRCRLDMQSAAGALAEGAGKGVLGRFGHHPDPAVDFCVEVESLHGRFYDASHCISNEPVSDVLSDIRTAMEFRVGGCAIALRAKTLLRKLERDAEIVVEAGEEMCQARAAVAELIAERDRLANIVNSHEAQIERMHAERAELVAAATAVERLAIRREGDDRMFDRLFAALARVGGAS